MQETACDFFLNHMWIKCVLHPICWKEVAQQKTYEFHWLRYISIHINAYQYMSIHINTCQYISIHVNTYHTSSHKQKGFWTHNKGLVFNHQVECSSTNPLCGLDSQTQHQSLSGLAAKMNQKRWQKHVNAVDFPFHNYQGLKLKNTECIHSMKHSPWTFLDFLNALEKWCLFFEFICGHLGRPKDSCSKSYFKKACHNDGLQTANLRGQLFEIIQIPYFGSSYHEPSSATRGMTMALKTWTNLTKNVQKSPRLYNKVQVHTTFNIYSATVSKESRFWSN